MQKYKKTLPAFALAACCGSRVVVGLLAGIVTASLSGAALAQCDTYTVAPASTDFVPGVTDTGLHADDGTMFVAFPFNVSLYGQSFAGGNVSSNGNIQFATNSAVYTNACLPTTTMNGITIFPFWDDLYAVTTASGQGIFTAEVGTSPDRQFIIEWRTTYCCGTGAPINSFEVVFYENQNYFDFVYGTPMGDRSSATVGVQFASNGPSTQISCNTAGPVTGQSYRFSCAMLLPGACCAVDGSCSLVTQTNCLTPSSWNGGATCGPNPCPQPPANDDCVNAEVIAAVPFAGSVLPTPSNDDIDVSCNSTANVATRNGVWYQFTSGPDGGRLVLGETGPNDVVIGVFSGFDCNSLSEIACFDAEANDNVDLPGNTTVWILVGMWSTTTLPNGTYNLTANYIPFVPGACCAPDGSCSIQTLNVCTSPSTFNGGASCEPNPCPQPPANDNCSGATVVSLGTTSGDNALASTETTVSCTTSNRDVWYSFTAAADGLYVFDTEGSTQGDTVLALFDQCFGTQLACDDDGGTGLLSRIEYALVANQTVYVRVASFGTAPAGGGFNLNISAIGSGACCGNTTGACSITSSTGCPAGSTYLGNDTTCDNSPCGTPGACCSTTGTCTVRLSSACTGYYVGDGSVCDVETCVLGACCSGTSCTLTNQFGCTGNFLGAGTSCDSATPYANLNLALAIPDYAGTVIPATSTISTTDTTLISDLQVRVNISHTWGGDVRITLTGPNGTVIDLFDRPGTASCTPGEIGNGNDLVGTYTFSDSAATNINTALIAGPSPLASGSYRPSTCAGVDTSLNGAFAGIPVTGDWTISVSDEDEAIVGTFNSFELVVNGGTAPCQPVSTTGACCAGSTCSVTASGSCTGANTHYAGDGTVCNVPGNNTNPCCKADYNQSGAVTVQDIFDFLNGYFTQSPAADINGASGVTVQDIFDFLSAYFTGC